MEFIDHVKVENPNITLPAPFLDESVAKEISEDLRKEFRKITPVKDTLPIT